MSKVHIIGANLQPKTCIRCGGDLFRLTKSKCSYLNIEKTQGTYRDIEICDGCEYRTEYNIIEWRTAEQQQKEASK